ncbi:MAG: acyl carrier protein [Oscillospiraceae bacterium]|nr:acyl carrier protein [Oscillospiraceae bacterium]
MRQKVLECLREVCPAVDFESSCRLVDDGLLDSLAIISIIGELMDRFRIDIDADDIVTENFNSLDGLTRMVEHKVA